MRRDLENKMIEPAAEACPHCGLPKADWRCRPVPSGFFCQAKGLIADPARQISSVQSDPLREQIEADPKVEHARAKHDAAQREFEAAHNAWEAAALAARQARQARSAVRREVTVGGRLTEVAPGGPTLGQISRLEDAAATAALLREDAGERAIKARTELDGCRQWVRGELEAVADVAAIRQSIGA